MRTITPAQQHFIATLAHDREISARAGGLLPRATEGTLSAREASGLIDLLKAAPRRLDLPAPAAAEPGYYLTEADDVIVVVENKDKTRTYAKRLTFHTGADGASRARWEYAPGVGRTLAGIAPLTAQDAARLGHLCGFCVICCKPLTDPESVLRGIGPICVRRLSVTV